MDFAAIDILLPIGLTIATCFAFHSVREALWFLRLEMEESTRKREERNE